MSDKKRQGPLLFTQSPPANMQSVYTSKQVIELEPEPELDRNSKKMAARVDDLVPIQVQDKSKPKEKTPHSSFKRVKSFKEMDLNERLDYLLHYPNVLPPVACVFQTTRQNYQGYLIELNDTDAIIQLQDQSTKNIPVDELIDIRMNGIKR